MLDILAKPPTGGQARGTRLTISAVNYHQLLPSLPPSRKARQTNYEEHLCPYLDTDRTVLLLRTQLPTMSSPSNKDNIPRPRKTAAAPAEKCLTNAPAVSSLPQSLADIATIWDALTNMHTP